jgi:chromosome segregation ATPase
MAELMKVGDKKLKTEIDLQNLTKNIEGVMAQHLSHIKKLENLNEICNRLGSVPSGLEKYSKTSSKDLFDKLKKINVSAKDKDGVNQKAAEQYDEINTKYEQFTADLLKYEEQRTDLDHLVQDLKTKKAEAMWEYFKMFQEQFQNIFTSIVRQGKAELVLYGDGFEVNSTNMSDDVKD